MDTPHDVNSPQMRQVFGNRIPIDDPILGDNPKVVALRAARKLSKSDLNDALSGFFPKPSETPDSEQTDSQTIPTKPNERTSIIALFKMLLEYLCK